MSDALKKEGESIEVGDIMEVTHSLGGSYRYTITRVTKNYAFTRINEYAEGKFRRHVYWSGPQPVPRPKWQTTEYKVWRKPA